MKREKMFGGLLLCLLLCFTNILPVQALPQNGVDILLGEIENYEADGSETDTPEVDDTEIQDPVEDETEKQISSSKVTKVYIVAKGKARINWTKSKQADGYVLYRRNAGSSDWKKIATVEGSGQLYCYDSKVTAKKTYYYTVKAYILEAGKKKYAEFDTSGYKKRFNKVTVSLGKGDYKTGSVYGPSLSKKQLSEVKAAVQKFCDKYVTSDMSDVEKAITAQLYLARYCTYADDWSKNGANTAWGALVYKGRGGYHEAQCSGFARGYKALCDGMGVKCRYVHANSKSANPSHQWNEVKIGKKWYIVDPQCNVTSGALVFFLCGGTTYTNNTGMMWDKKSYPQVSSKDYPYEKIDKAWNGYKIRKVYNKLFG
ncbi:MAG: transglutaminase-like domain-containing protein [Ruminococcus flavefaciens]|nr:transglutaminase-like domain-containing protein [Ruminococcus flavefaciens]